MTASPDHGRWRASACLLLLAAAALEGCTFDQPARWPAERWTEFHRQLKAEVVAAHQAPLEGRCEAPPATDEAAGITPFREFDKLWRYDQPWPPVADFVSQVGTLDDFEIELGYAYLTDREANPRRAYVVFSDHMHRFPRSTRGELGRVHAHLTIGDLTSAESALAELTGAKAVRHGAGVSADSTAAAASPAAEAVAEGTLPSPWAPQEAEFVRWLVGWLNCRPGADGLLDRGPEKNGAEDLTGTARPTNFLGMEQLKEPPRPGPLSYVGFILTPVTFFGERVIDLVERDDLPRLPRWPDLAVLPGREGGGPPTWHVAGFMRGQAPASPEADRGWADRSARFLACSLRPRWAAQWVPRLHDAPDLGYFPHYADVYATIGRMALAQGERTTVEDLCDALVALLLASHQDEENAVIASEISWLWYRAVQRDDPQLARRQPFLAPERRFGEQAVTWAAELLLEAPPPPSPGARVRDVRTVLDRAGALDPPAPFAEDGVLAVAALRVLAAALFQMGPELRGERPGEPMTRRAQDLVQRLALPTATRNGRGTTGFARGPWHLTPRGLPGTARGVPGERRPLQPWHDAVFVEHRALLESWLGALESDHRHDPAVLERCALVRDRLWR